MSYSPNPNVWKRLRTFGDDGMGLPISCHKFPLTTGIELRLRRNSKYDFRPLCAPIIVPGSLDNLSGLRIPDSPGNGQLQGLVDKTRELLVDGDIKSLRCI